MMDATELCEHIAEREAKTVRIGRQHYEWHVRMVSGRVVVDGVYSACTHMDAIAAAGAELELHGGAFPIDSVECREVVRGV